MTRRAAAAAAVAVLTSALAGGCAARVDVVEAHPEPFAEPRPVDVAPAPATNDGLPLLDTSLAREADDPWPHRVLLRYPLLPEDHPAAATVNTTLRDEVRALADGFVAGIDPSLPSPGTDVWLEGAYTLGLASERVLSLSMERTEHLGGAHPVHWTTGLTFDLRTGERLGLDDLVTADGRGALAALATEELVRRFGEELRPEATVPPGALDDVRLDAVGFVLLFDQYEYGPGAAGPQEVVVPLAAVEAHATPRLRELLAPSGTTAVQEGP